MVPAIEIIRSKGTWADEIILTVGTVWAIADAVRVAVEEGRETEISAMAISHRRMRELPPREWVPLEADPTVVIRPEGVRRDSLPPPADPAFSVVLPEEPPIDPEEEPEADCGIS